VHDYDTLNEAYGQMRKRYAAFFSDDFPYWNLSYPLGWHPRVMQLLDDITVALPPEHLARFRIFQIKEKFGGLRLYFEVRSAHSSDGDGDGDSAPSEDDVPFPAQIVRDLIDAANEDCNHICQRCGQEGVLAEERGWWRVLCYPCSRK